VGNSAPFINEVDLATLSDHLVAVVEETMQPEHISLWLRQQEPKEQHTPKVESGYAKHDYSTPQYR
jgi:hypothetical protein